MDLERYKMTTANQNKHSESIHPVIIIGTGPAGLTAALYAARANLKPLVFAGKEPGGQLTLTTLVENFPGFSEGIMGPELMSQMEKQAQRFGAQIIHEKILKVDFSQRPFKLSSDNNITYFCHSVIVATGASAKFLGLPQEKELTGKGVSTCATCDGFFYRDKVIHVVGGGDTAIEEATFLTKFATSVTIIHRRDQLRASKIMIQKAEKNPKIHFLYEHEVIELVADQEGLTGIKVQNVKTKEITLRPTHGLFYGIGHTPNTAFLDQQVEIDEHGLIKTHHNTHTSIEGVFACGDVQDPHYRQAITAAGSGCSAALAAEKFLEHHDMTI
jgi:thioredoxin reductase (NADPH)